MPKPDLGAIRDQPDFPQVPELSFQPLPRNRFKPIPDSNCGIVQQPAQSSDDNEQFCSSGILDRNMAQTYRLALIDADHPPDKTANLGDPLSGSHLSNLLNPCMIESVDRHGVPPVSIFFDQNYFNRISSADQQFDC